MDQDPIRVDAKSSDNSARLHFSIQRSFNKTKLIEESQCHYSVSTLLLLFLTISILAWAWETFFYLFDSGIAINPGVLHGPWLSIYGSGGVLILLLLKRWRARPLLTFLMTIAICGVVEYSTGWFLEIFTGTTWWDYSSYSLNFGKYLCVEGLLLFGIAGTLLIYVLAPTFATLVQKIPVRVKVVALVVLLSIFSADAALSLLHPNYMASSQNPIILNLSK